MTNINWQSVEAGDVVEFHDGERITLPPQESDQWDVYHDDGNVTLRIGPECYDGDEILAIYKNGTVGAMSEEERSRLWDKMEAYSINVLNRFPGCSAYEGKLFGVVADGATPLEAVAKCVAAIEAKENADG